VASEAIFVHGQNLRAFSLRSGRALWHAYAGSYSYGWLFNEKNGTRPAVSGSSIYASGKDGVLYALDASSGKRRWTFSAAAPILGSPLASDDAVFFLANDGYLYAVEADTGKLRWKFLGGGDAVRERKSYDYGSYPQDRVRAQPALDAQRVYFATGAGLVYGLSRHDGSVAWKRKLGDATSRDLTLDGSRLFVAGEQHSLYALNTEDGTIVWQYARRAGAPARVANGVLVTLLSDGEAWEEQRVTAFDLASDLALRGRAKALSTLAEKLERENNKPMLEALLRNVASTEDSDFRSLHLRMIRLRAEAGDVEGVLKSASRLLSLRDGDDSWFPELDRRLQQALTKAAASAPPTALPTPTRGPTLTRIPVQSVPQTLRAYLDALPFEDRAQGLPAELMLLAGTQDPAQKVALLKRMPLLRNRLAAPFLHPLTASADSELRVLAALKLADMGDYSAKPVLREALLSADVGQRRAAVQAVKKSYEPSDTDALKALLNDDDITVRTEVALLVAEHEPVPAALTVLHGALADADEGLKIRIALVLGKHGDRAGAPILRALLRERRGSLPAQAAAALAELDDHTALPVLLEARKREKGASFLSTRRFLIGKIYMLLEEDRSAFLEYRSILLSDPDFDRVHFNIGRLYYLRGRDTEALQALDTALQANPLLASARVYRGLARARLGNTAEAMKDIDEALETDPNEKMAHLARAEVLVRRGAFEAAERVIAEALQRWSSNADAYEHAARLRLGRANPTFANLPVAEGLAQRAVALRPDDASTLQTLAEVYAAQGQAKKALGTARRAMRAAVGDAARDQVRSFLEKLEKLATPAEAPPPAAPK
jgi:tetratricopeptide (TPR) repeat protein